MRACRATSEAPSFYVQLMHTRFEEALLISVGIKKTPGAVRLARARAKQ